MTYTLTCNNMNIYLTYNRILKIASTYASRKGWSPVGGSDPGRAEEHTPLSLSLSLSLSLCLSLSLSFSLSLCLSLSLSASLSLCLSLPLSLSL